MGCAVGFHYTVELALGSGDLSVVLLAPASMLREVLVDRDSPYLQSTGYFSECGTV